MLLSVLMPSNRDLANSRKAIESALAFCERRDAVLIVSDNSGDAEKRLLLEGASPRLRYIRPPDDTPLGNLRHVLDAAETEFVLVMGDDDQLFVSPQDTPRDLATLPEDCVGVRPLIAVVNAEGRVIRVKDFAIAEDSPSARVMGYNAHAGGDNAAYYAIYRRRPFVDLMHFYLDHHPLKAGFNDWALTCAMFALGKLPYDPGVVFRYNYHQWDTDAKREVQLSTIYDTAGLPRHAGRYGLLLLYLDLVILGSRRGAPLDAAAKEDLERGAGKPILDGFAKAVLAEPAAYPPEVARLARAMPGEADAAARMTLALAALDGLLPGLSERYRDFRRIADA